MIQVLKIIIIKMLPGFILTMIIEMSRKTAMSMYYSVY